ncbi:MAG: DUF4351 domain-containing protein [Luteitalea sp.]|nr:DUF4351 domain-containing protein [Luteitalea sp.]
MSPVPYDQTLKFLADIDPEALLRVLGALAPDVPAVVTPVPRDVSAPVRLPDLLYDVSTAEGVRVAHVEVQTRDEAAMDDRVLEYAVLGWLRLRKPIDTYLLVLTPRGGARRSPSRVVVRAGGLVIVVRYRVVRLWDMPAAQVLAAGRPSLLPFVPLMRRTETEVLEALRRLRAIPDDRLRRELAGRFALLGGLRYNKTDLLMLVEERGMVTLEDLRESSFYQYILEEGERKGQERGFERGEAALLQRLLERRFGPLPSWAAERIEAADRATVEAWGVRVLDANATRLEDLLT